MQHPQQAARAIQEQAAPADKTHPKMKAKGAMPAGARLYPAPPFPKQHQQKPRSEAAVDRPPEEIAPVFVFLASPQCSSYTTGEILPIIGGYSGG